MNLITRIFAIDVPAGTSMRSLPELSFRGFTLGWLAFVLAIMLIGMFAVAFFYFLERGTLGWFRRIFLIGLRCTLLLLLLFLIMRPVLLTEFAGKRPQGVALLVDSSQSMLQRDRRMTTGDKWRVAVTLGKHPAKEALPTTTTDLPSDAKSNPPRKDLVTGILKHEELKLLAELQKYGPVRPYLFGGDIHGLQDSGAAKTPLADRIIAAYTEALKTDAERKKEDKKDAPERFGRTSRTALADSIIKILQSKDGDPPSAIVVFTDGQDNASKFTLQEAAEKCRLAKVPLHIYGVGSSEGGQLQLQEVGSPDTLFAEDNVVIPIRWRAQGFKQGSYEIVATLGGKEVFKKSFATLPTGEDLRELLTFQVPKDLPKHPDKGDNHDLVTTITYKSGAETFKDVIERPVHVANSKLRLLYVEHSPRWEFKFLQPMLMRDRRIHNSLEKGKEDRLFLLVNADPKVAEEAPYLPEFPKAQVKFLDAKYDLIILGDVETKVLGKEQQLWIKEFVEKGGGLIVMSGRQNMPSAYEGMPLAEILPVEFRKEKTGAEGDIRTQEYPPTLTAEGLRTAWLTLADTPEENVEVWQKRLQGFHWNYPVTKLRSAATSLIVNPRMKIGDDPKEQQPMPIMAHHYYGKGQVVWLGTDETWRWRWNYQDKYFVRLWGQMIYQVGLPSLLRDGTKRVQMALENSQAIVGKTGKIYVRIVDKDFKPRTDPTVDAVLEFLDAKERRQEIIKLRAVDPKQQPGEYTAILTNDRPGRVKVTVQNNQETSTFQYRVELPPKHELEESGLNERVLREAARISGGRFYREEDLHTLTEDMWGAKARLIKIREEIEALSGEQKSVDAIADRTEREKKQETLDQKRTRLDTEFAEQTDRLLPSKEFSRRQEILLWNPLAILFFLGLLTMEWVVRKFSDLS